MATRRDKRATRKKKQKLRRAKKKIKYYTNQVKTQEKKIVLLKRARDLLKIGNDFAQLLPDLAPKITEDNLPDFQKLIDLNLRSVAIETSEEKHKTGIARVRTEADTLKSFASKMAFHHNLVVFIRENKMALWAVFCISVFARKNAEGSELHWDEREARHEYEMKATQLWLLMGWKAAGRSFLITSLLTNTFSVADVPVPSESLELPFPFMVLEVPPRFFTKRKNSSLSPIADFLIGSQVHENGDRTLFIDYTPIHNDAASGTSSVQFRKGTSIQQNIEEFCRKATGMDEQWMQILNFICNVTLYCASFPSDVLPHNQAKLERLEKQLGKQQGGKRKKTSNKLQQARSDSIYIVGRNFRLDDQRVSDELSYEDGRKLRVRHIVRGHWRNQACGPRHQERKLIFVQPFWRGTGKEEPPKTYMVK